MSAQTYSNYRPDDEMPLTGLFAQAMEEADDSVFDDAPEEEPLPEPPPVETEEHEAPRVVTLRSYQEQAISSVMREFKQKVNATLVVSATGTGKAIMLAELARRASDYGHGVLILVHRDELIRQLVKSCALLGIHGLVEKAQERALPGFGHFSNVVVASVQTLRGKRLEEWPKNAFKLCIVDECHHVQPTGSYADVLNYFGHEEGRLRVAGFTATADRLTGENIGSVFESLAFEYNIADATKAGWLVPVEAMQIKTDPVIDLKDLRVTGGDLNQGDLERVVNDNIGVLVNAIADTKALEEDGRPLRTMAFTPNIASARALAMALSDIGISAISVAGADADRHARFRAHQSGQYQVLTNCAVATEGYDDPAIEAVLMCRPTKSRALYSQMVGRGTRLFECPKTGRVKQRCRIVDFAFVTGKHKLVSPVDLFDNSQTPDEVVELARDILASGRETQIEMALELAACEYEQERRVKIQRRLVASKASKFDPLTACELYGIPQKADYALGTGSSCTEGQKAYLEKRGIETTNMSKGMASSLISKLEARREHGWANPWQVRDLIQSGVDVQTATGMREGAAREYLERNPIKATDKQVGLLVGKFGWSRAEAAALSKRDAIAAINAANGGGQ